MLIYAGPIAFPIVDVLRLPDLPGIALHCHPCTGMTASDPKIRHPARTGIYLSQLHQGCISSQYYAPRLRARQEKTYRNDT